LAARCCKIFDHPVQDIEPDYVGLFRRGLLRAVTQAGLVVLLQIRAQDLLAIHGGHYVGSGGAVAAAKKGQQSATQKNEDG
jgi:hypothetical protein